MVAYVFVYSPSKFRADGEYPLKRFEPGSHYASAETAIFPMTEAVIDRGIYAILSDADDVGPEVYAADSRITVDYDVLLINDKDPWPSFSEPDSHVDPEMRERVRAAFPALRDEDLALFLVTRGAA